MLAFPCLIHQNLSLSSATKEVQQVIIKLESKNKPFRFYKNIGGSHSISTSFKIPAYILALNTDTDVPPIIGDTVVIHKYKHDTSIKEQRNNDNPTDINPYRSRSVLYVQPKKVTPNEIKDA